MTGSVGSSACSFAEQGEPLAPARRVARVVQVDQRRVELRGVRGAEHRRRRAHRLDDEALALEQQAERFEHVGLVVGDQDARRELGHVVMLSKAVRET